MCQLTTHYLVLSISSQELQHPWKSRMSSNLQSRYVMLWFIVVFTSDVMGKVIFFGNEVMDGLVVFFFILLNFLIWGGGCLCWVSDSYILSSLVMIEWNSWCWNVSRDGNLLLITMRKQLGRTNKIWICIEYFNYPVQTSSLMLSTFRLDPIESACSSVWFGS